MDVKELLIREEEIGDLRRLVLKHEAAGQHGVAAVVRGVYYEAIEQLRENLAEERV
jgi:hypothetical protein